jgi:hypothetical protein
MNGLAENTPHVFHALNQHGTLIACKKLWDAGYELDDIERELQRTS